MKPAALTSENGAKLFGAVRQVDDHVFVALSYAEHEQFEVMESIHYEPFSSSKQAMAWLDRVAIERGFESYWLLPD